MPTSVPASLVLTGPQERFPDDGKALLESAGLPIPLDDRKGPWWTVRTAAGRLEGLVGMEVYGGTSLLRSLALNPRCRERGLGSRLVLTALAQVRDQQAHSVFLLTETATAFFPRFGFEAAERSALPAELLASDEFRGACPDTATLMRLTGPGLESPLCIRAANPSDAADLARIYNQGIEDGSATFETTPRTPTERRRWLTQRDPRYRVLVAMSPDRVTGWLSLNPFSPRAAYRAVADFSIYVERESRHTGIGRRLLARGLAEARAHGFHKAILTLFPENTPARALYRSAGFVTAGLLREQGWLQGKWRDTVLMEKILAGPEM